MSLASLMAAVLAGAAVAAGGSSGRRVRCRLGHEPRTSTGLRELTAALGRLITRGAVDPPDEALAGSAALAAGASLVVMGPLGPAAVAVAAATAVAARRRGRARSAEMRIERALPEVLDLLSLVAGAGRPASAALGEISSRVAEPFRSEFAEVQQRSAAGESFVESVRRMRERLGPCVAEMVHAMTAAEIDGVPLQPSLLRAGDEAHRRRRVRAEEAARRVPVKMLFPLVFCVLPAFCLLTVIPLLLGTITDLQLP